MTCNWRLVESSEKKASSDSENQRRPSKSLAVVVVSRLIDVAMLFGSHGAVYTASICATISLMATVVVLPIVHSQFQRKLSLMLSNVEQCRVSDWMDEYANCRECRCSWKHVTSGSRWHLHRHLRVIDERRLEDRTAATPIPTALRLMVAAVRVVHVNKALQDHADLRVGQGYVY